MISTIASLTASIAMAATMATADFQAEPQWQDIGVHRVSTYCPFAMTELVTSPVPANTLNTAIVRATGCRSARQ